MFLRQCCKLLKRIFGHALQPLKLCPKFLKTMPTQNAFSFGTIFTPVPRPSFGTESCKLKQERMIVHGYDNEYGLVRTKFPDQV